ncbi:MAG: TetR/AcrR family transcriptional regulator [Beijerinckiaceae bacterium]
MAEVTAQGKTKRKPRVATWTQDPEGVRRNILAVAWREFVENGLSGARVDDIAAKTSTSKRMIYYYFTDKEGLYRAVLAEAYGRIRALERTLDLDVLPPDEALRRLTAFTFDYHADNTDFVRLVMIENIHYGEHLKTLGKIRAINLSAIDVVRAIYDRGVAAGVFRAGIDPIDIHLTISALSFYNVSNRESIRQVFRHDMAGRKARQQRCATVVETVMRYVLSRPHLA